MVFSRRNEKFAKHVTLYIALTNTKLNKEEIARLVTIFTKFFHSLSIYSRKHGNAIYYEINLIRYVRLIRRNILIIRLNSFDRFNLSSYTSFEFQSVSNFDFEIFLTRLSLPPRYHDRQRIPEAYPRDVILMRGCDSSQRASATSQSNIVFVEIIFVTPIEWSTF